MNLLFLGDQWQGRIGDEEILQVVVDMRQLAAARIAGHLVAVDREGQVATAVPGVQHGAGDARLLHRLAERRGVEARCRLVMAARLEPAAMIRADLIEKQDALIGLLYDAQSASDEMKRRKSVIDRQKERLESHGFRLPRKPQ